MQLSYRDLEHGITCIETYYTRPELASCYLIVEGDEAALIDTGTAHTTPLILELLERKGIAREQLRYVVPTHVHLDHAGGTGQLMQALPEARLIVHPRGARHMIEPSKLEAGVRAVYGDEIFVRDYDHLLPVPAQRVTEAPDGFRFHLGQRELRCIDTPGHAKHHFCVWDERSRGLFTGDTFGISYRDFDTGQGPFMFLPSTPVQFDPQAWHRTLDRLLELQPRHAYLTHYCEVEHPERLAPALHALIDAYVEIALDCDPEDRRRSLCDGLAALYRERLAAHGWNHDEAEFQRLLGMDIELCAQGLEVWLDQRQG